MAKLKYVGPHDAVVVPMPLGGEQIVGRGEVLNTDRQHGQDLLEQPANWEEVSGVTEVAQKDGGEDPKVKAKREADAEAEND